MAIDAMTAIKAREIANDIRHLSDSGLEALARAIFGNGDGSFSGLLEEMRMVDDHARRIGASDRDPDCLGQLAEGRLRATERRLGC